MTMKTENPKFEKGLVLLCTRCKPRLAKRNIDCYEFETLKSELKTKWKKSGHWGKIRACETTCLGHCPAAGSTIYIYKRSTNTDLCISIESEMDQQEIIDSIESIFEFEN